MTPRLLRSIPLSFLFTDHSGRIGASDTQHLRNKLLRYMQFFGTHAILDGKEPAGEAGIKPRTALQAPNRSTWVNKQSAYRAK